MGSQALAATFSKVISKYNCIGQINDKHFGRVKLFRKKTQNFDYLMIISRLMHRDFVKDVEKELKSLTNYKHIMPLMKIFLVFVGDHDCLAQHTVGKSSPSKVHSINNTCYNQKQQEQCLTICLQYLNFSLKQHLAFKKSRNQQISLSQYSYILKTALNFTIIIQELRLQYLDFDISPQHFFITSKGELKVYPLRSQFLYQKKENCQCLNNFDCLGPNLIMKEKRQCQASTPIRLNKYNDKINSCKKYLKQIKNLSLNLIDNIDFRKNKRNKKGSESNPFLLNQTQIQEIKNIHLSISSAKSISEIALILKPVKDDFLILETTSFQNSSQNSLNNNFNSRPTQSNQQNQLTYKINKQNRPALSISKHRSNKAETIFTRETQDIQPDFSKYFKIQQNNNKVFIKLNSQHSKSVNPISQFNKNPLTFQRIY